MAAEPRPLTRTMTASCCILHAVSYESYRRKPGYPAPVCLCPPEALPRGCCAA